MKKIRALAAIIEERLKLDPTLPVVVENPELILTDNQLASLSRLDNSALQALGYQEFVKVIDKGVELLNLPKNISEPYIAAYLNNVRVKYKLLPI